MATVTPQKTRACYEATLSAQRSDRRREGAIGHIAKTTGLAENPAGITVALNQHALTTPPFQPNPCVVAKALYRAGGQCHAPARVTKHADPKVHHRTPLAEYSDENASAPTATAGRIPAPYRRNSEGDARPRPPETCESALCPAPFPVSGCPHDTPHRPT